MVTRSPKEKVLSKRVLVSLRRDQTTQTARVVWQHELPLLEAIFGEGNAVEMETSGLDEGYNPRPSADMLVYNKRQDTIPRPSTCAGIGFVFMGDARQEYERLASAYGRHDEKNMPVVEYVFGRFQQGQFEAAVSGAEIDDMPDAQLRSVIISGGYLPAASHNATSEEKQIATEAKAAFDALDRGGLLKVAEAMDIASYV